MFRSGKVGAWDSCLDVKLWQKLWGKGTSRGGSQGPGGSLTSFLALNAWFWGCWRWRTFVVDGDPRDPELRPLPPPRKVHSSGVILALLVGIWD